jgi:hypothetical protein
MMAGAVVSTMETENVQVLWRLNVLVATQVTKVVPSWKVDGDVGEQDVETARPESSVAVAAYVAVADGELPVVE